MHKNNIRFSSFLLHIFLKCFEENVFYRTNKPYLFCKIHGKHARNNAREKRGKSAGKRNQLNIFEFDWLNKHYVNKFQYGGVSSAKKWRPVDDLESKKFCGFY